MAQKYRFVMKKISDIKPREEVEIEAEYEKHIYNLTTENDKKSFFKRESRSTIDMMAKMAIKNYGTCKLSDEFYVSNQNVTPLNVTECDIGTKSRMTDYSFVSSKSLSVERCHVPIVYSSEVIEKCKERRSKKDVQELSKDVGFDIVHPTVYDEHEDLTSLFEPSNIIDVVFNRKSLRTVRIATKSGRRIQFDVERGYVIIGICGYDISNTPFDKCPLADI
jgi:hypothetical protein